MKTKAKIYIIAVSLGFLSSQAFTASSGLNNRDDLQFDRTNPAGQDPIVENNYYYGDGDYIYDYYYASRIRRFHTPYVSYSYYNSYFTDCYWYTYEPSYWGMSIYLGSMWNPVGLSISFGFPYRSYYRSYYYDPYLSYPVYNIVYRPRIVNRYYYNTWYGNRIRYHRPYYANRYNYYNNYRDFHKGGYYSRSYKYASNYDAGNNYRKNQVVPSRASSNRDNNRNSNVINSSRRSSPTNTARTGNYNRNAEKDRRVVSNYRNINRSQNKTETRRSTYVPSNNESRRSVYKVPQKSSNRTRISKPANTKQRPSSYRAPAKTKKSNVKSGNSRSNNSSKKVTRSSGSSKSSQKKSSGKRR